MRILEMNYLKFSTLLLLTSLFTVTIHAQTKTEKAALSLNDGTIDNQFEYVIQKSYTYRGNGKIYKNVERHWLYALKAHTLDSLKALKKDLSDTQANVDTQANEISGLKTNLADTQNNLNKTNKEKNSMALFGLQMSKTIYNLLMWSIIAALFVLLLLFIYKYRNSNSVTRLTKNTLLDIEEEFEEHRRNALEREQLVRRQLQDELNKQKGT
jgi:hypothetical protein